MNWHTVVGKIRPYIVKIETPTGHGTGFLCLRNAAGNLSGIATAHHVVEYADQWQQPIRIKHLTSKKTKLFKESDRVIFGDEATDSALILLKSDSFDLPKDLIPLLGEEFFLKIGVEVGWVGFPAMEPDALCFFSGNISARKKVRKAYLLDGVAINGVSGGPVFDDGDDGKGPRIIGVVTAYIANRATGGTLPGLAYAQDLSHFHEIATSFKNIAEANQQKQLLEQKPSEPSVPVSPQPGSRKFYTRDPPNQARKFKLIHYPTTPTSEYSAA
jgi:hypothetical protein